MGLTKPRAAQIFNLDYKQSTRVVTATNITLTGGAPNSVDGVTLSLNDRVLVTGQSTGSQNGLYLVTTLGSGNNGTWARTTDGDQTGEIEAGMIVMVTEGVIYADTQWKLITDDPITINVTALTFTQNYSANSISGGTSNVVVNSNANVTISSAGTANVLLVSSTGTVTSGTASVTGNITGNYFIGNGSQLTGLPATYGNANVATFLAEYGSNTISSTGTITAGNITGGNVLTGGAVSATGNITGNYMLGNGALLTGVITSVANINNGTSNVTVVSSGGNVTVGVGGTGNVAVFSTSGLDVTGRVSASGNITGGNILGNGAGLSGINTFSNVTVTGGNSAIADSIADTLTLTAGDGITIVIDPTTDTITIGTQSGSEIFVDGADFGTVTEPVTLSDDLGLVTDAVTEEADLGSLVTAGLIYPDQFVLPSFTTTTLPSASVAGAMIYVTNEAGGAVPAFADGTNWRRVTDRAIVT
jgi:hypothetical protein